MFEVLERKEVSSLAQAPEDLRQVLQELNLKPFTTSSVARYQKSEIKKHTTLQAKIWRVIEFMWQSVAPFIGLVGIAGLFGSTLLALTKLDNIRFWVAVGTLISGSLLLVLYWLSLLPEKYPAYPLDWVYTYPRDKSDYDNWHTLPGPIVETGKSILAQAPTTLLFAEVLSDGAKKYSGLFGISVDGVLVYVKAWNYRQGDIAYDFH